MNKIIIPPEFYKTGHYYRTFGHNDCLGMIGCGFMQKKGCFQEAMQVYGHYALVYVLAGTGTYTDDNGNEFPVYPGCIFQRFTDRKHSLSVYDEEPWLECFIAFKYTRVNDKLLHSKLKSWISDDWIGDVNVLPDYSREVIELLSLLDTETPVIDFGIDLNIISKINSIYEQMKVAPLRRVHGLHFQLLSILNDIAHFADSTPEEIREETLVEKICSLIQDNLDRRVSLPLLLGGLGTSYSTLRRIFKKNMGISIGSYLIQLRIDEAYKLLAQGNSVKETAFKLGYNSQFSLSSQFKKFTGVSPNKI